METLMQQLKEQLIEALNLEDIAAADIGDDMPLFGDGLGLDSIDALEIVLILEKYHGVKVAKPSEAKEIFYSVRTLATYIEQNRA